MMRTRLLLVLTLLCVASCQTPDSAPADGADVEAAQEHTSDSARADGAPSPDVDLSETLTADGWGPLRIGMTRAEVVAAAGEDANPEAVGGPDPEQCDAFRPALAPTGMLVMIEQGRLTRITLTGGSEVETEEGFGVGDSASAIKTAYGARASVTPHKYVPAPAEYITVWNTDARPPAPDARGMVYEVGADARVTHVHAGGPSITYVEGCL